MTTTDLHTLVLHLNDTQSKQKLEELRKKMDTIRDAKQKAFEQLDLKKYHELSTELAKLQRSETRLASTTETVERTLRALDRATPRELQQTIKTITRELNSGNIERGSKEWNTYTQALKEAKTELTKIKQEQQALTSTASTPSSLAQKWTIFAAALTIAKDKISAALQSVANLVTQHAALAEHMADVRKYTGLATTDVEELNQEFKQMDTRTARAQLNDLAADAGRLGITSKQQILDFVTAADQINVALGKDLGEDAVKSIGKLSQMFNEANALGLKQGMLSIGSTINQLAQTSSASEPYILEFTNRLAGVATQSGLTAAQIMAFASIMDQNAVNVEKGATALQNVIVALFQQPQKLAQTAGLEVKQFTTLLKQDANAALLQFLQALNQKGGMDRLAPILKEMNLSGAGVTQTLTTLAAHIDDITQTQQLATQAFQQGTSCTNEAALANNTLAARIEKAQAHLSDLKDELGRRLTPVYLSFLSTTTTLATALQFLFQSISTASSFFLSHLKTITATTTGLLVFTAAIKANTIATTLATTLQRLHTAALTIYHTTLTAATTAQKAFTAAIKANGLTALTSAVLAAVAAFTTYILTNARTAASIDNLAAKQRTQQQIQKDQTTVTQNAQQAAAKETAQLRLLTSTLHDNTASLAERRRALQQLQSIVPSYTASINEEGRITRENTAALTQYVEALKKKYLLQAISNKMQTLAEEQLYHEEQNTKYQQLYTRRLQALNNFEKQHRQELRNINRLEEEARRGSLAASQTLASSATARQHAQLRAQLTEADHLLTSTTHRLDTLEARLQALTKRAQNTGLPTTSTAPTAAVTSTTTPTSSETTHTTPTSSGTDHHTSTALQRIKEENQATRAALQLAADQQVITHQECNEKLIEADIHMYKQMQALHKTNTTQYNQTTHQLIEAQNQLQQLQTTHHIQALQAQEKVEQNQLTSQYLKQNITHQHYQQQQLQIKLKYLQLYIQKAQQAADTDALQRYQQQYDELYQSQALQRVNDFWQKVDAARKEWLSQPVEQQKADELNLAQLFKQQGILSPEEYEKAIQYINEKYKNPTTAATTNASILSLPTDTLSPAIVSFANQISQLNQKIKEGTASWQDYAAVGIASINILNAALASTAQLISAQSQAEQNRVTAAYDAQIKAASNNSRRAKQLEEQKQKELAQIKTKYNKRQTRIQIAQAIAQTAMNALLAYGSVVRIPIIGPAMAAAAAAAAVAAGAIQIAAIKMQSKEQDTGYYKGGYTRGHSYHQVAGVVHQGEFVMNHEAVNNPALQPILQLIDNAQRTGRIAQLTPQAVALAATPTLATSPITTAATTAALAAAPTPTITVQTTTTDTNTDTNNIQATLQNLNDQLSKGIQAHVVLTEFDHQYSRYKKLTNP